MWVVFQRTVVAVVVSCHPAVGTPCFFEYNNNNNIKMRHGFFGIKYKKTI